ncbi:hypothetical protein JHW43_003523 [Diplocarpon mali]|nr:hypothetical protein JHW43_003523 [Diplocarpon mali]
MKHHPRSTSRDQPQPHQVISTGDCPSTRPAGKLVSRSAASANVLPKASSSTAEMHSLDVEAGWLALSSRMPISTRRLVATTLPTSSAVSEAGEISPGASGDLFPFSS